VHLYVHVPFCRRRCTYCDFAIAVRKRVPHGRFTAAIQAESEMRRAAGDWPRAPFDTVYLGGGTPSQLAPAAIADLLGTFTWVAGAEITLEANPEDVTEPAARAWVEAGVTRVSLGVQSFAPRVLAWMHRSHEPGAAQRAVTALREAGAAVSLDLIVALPEDLGHEVLDDVERALALEPEHLSVYGLTLEPHTPFGHWVEWDRATPASDDRYAADFLAVHDVLTDAGFEHYEVSNYARRAPGAVNRARHNSAYWSDAPYLGLGPSAHGYQDGTRRWNLREWTAYERAVARGEDPIAGREALTEEQRFLERVYLTLRTDAALAPTDEARCDARALLAAEGRGWLTGGPGRRRATPAGWLVLDELVPALTTSPGGG